ncbi:class I SAM-dependent methyltransferase [Actinokineospora sp. HUAS TT18]|uniref:class I SAM-dependent methyltransferase n=1 Tax=Actinokineospora sp. HUAS TT18 TaxID=3447451 RepID=UPI003F52812E
MRRTDLIEAEVNSWVADRLVDALPDGATIVDVGSGSGGMSAAFATALSVRGGGRIVLVDAVPELQEAARSAVVEAVGDKVELVTVLADAADPELASLVPAADLIWASRVMHHLPDERAGVEALTRMLAPGGWLALAEGGLTTRCLPWDVGVGEPGLQDRLVTAQLAWYAAMRGGIEGAVRMPYGWNRLLSELGLSEVNSFSYLLDIPAPAPQPVRESVADWLGWMAHAGEGRVSAADAEALVRLCDPTGPDYVGARDDVFLLSATTVHLGRRTVAA